MLVLTRLPSQRIIVDTGKERIAITVVDSCRRAVRIGVEAPPHVMIAREELLSEGDRREV